ncbi:hypothetical protein K438DRAFT_1815364 [Mycena galopus ATCC 62051]|nr:hypothetical protein K438DRAFT_1815364 [Mycena galopus ATCC 62051]
MPSLTTKLHSQPRSPRSRNPKRTWTTYTMDAPSAVFSAPLRISSKSLSMAPPPTQPCPMTRTRTSLKITAGMEAARADDTSALKCRIHLYLNEDPTVPLDPPLPNLKDKLHRGRAHPVFAKLLTPIQWEANDTTYIEMAQGVKVVEGTELPRFIFPLNQVFPVGTDTNDPVWLDVLENACKGEICLRSAKAIYMGPESALECDGYHKGKPGKASIIGMTTFTRRIIAGHITQVYFSLSAKQDWHKKDGLFDYSMFFWTIYDLFEDTEWAADVIALWNRVVLGTTKPSTLAVPTPTGPNHLAQLKALRALRRAQAAEAGDGPAVPAVPVAGVNAANP